MHSRQRPGPTRHVSPVLSSSDPELHHSRDITTSSRADRYARIRIPHVVDLDQIPKWDVSYFRRHGTVRAYSLTYGLTSTTVFVSSASGLVWSHLVWSGHASRICVAYLTVRDSMSSCPASHVRFPALPCSPSKADTTCEMEIWLVVNDMIGYDTTRCTDLDVNLSIGVRSQHRQYCSAIEHFFPLVLDL